jgi:hypothetical protein
MKGFKNLNLHEKSYEMLRFMANSQGKSMSKLLDEILDSLFVVGINYPRTSIMEHETSILGHAVTFRFSGRSTFYVGTMSEQELAKMKDAIFKQVKKDVQKAKGEDN